MIETPKISVILPVYNCQEFVSEAVISILNQTFSNFELIIIDDCSTDKTLEIIKSFDDSRIKIIEKPKNSGYTDSLNFGIDIAKGEYIARMDGDDISLPMRFEKQVAFLDHNQDVIMCGSDIAILSSDKPLYKYHSHEEILVDLCFQNAFCHPTVMIRKTALLVNKYDKNFEPAEDYELWIRLSQIGKLANLNEVLLRYRVHENQISKSKNAIQKKHNFACNLKLLNKLNVLNEFDEHQIKSTIKPKNSTFEDFKIAQKVFAFLIKKNNQQKIFDLKIFQFKISKIRLKFLKEFLKHGQDKKINRFLFLLLNISIVDLLKTLEAKENLVKFMKLDFN
jgi:glycosyltransferase involved in cell wall biosynthesis